MHETISVENRKGALIFIMLVMISSAKRGIE